MRSQPLKLLASVIYRQISASSFSDPEGADSYPIVTYTWILAYKKYPNAAKAKADFEAAIEYALTEGPKKQATTLGYVPLPQNVIAKVVRLPIKLVQTIKSLLVVVLALVNSYSQDMRHS